MLVQKWRSDPERDWQLVRIVIVTRTRTPMRAGTRIRTEVGTGTGTVQQSWKAQRLRSRLCQQDYSGSDVCESEDVHLYQQRRRPR